jgi:hypothetical protein
MTNPRWNTKYFLGKDNANASLRVLAAMTMSDELRRRADWTMMNVSVRVPWKSNGHTLKGLLKENQISSVQHSWFSLKTQNQS